MGSLAWYHRTHPDASYKPRGSAEDRFWSHVDRSGGPDACWPWTGRRIWSGYGSFREGGRGSRSIGAHRFALQLKLGRPLRPDEQARHVVCDNPPCVNPAHLEPGVHTDNMADMTAKGRQATGDRHSSQTHPERIARGDRHGLRLHPERAARGLSNGAHTHPERRPQGPSHGMAGTGKLTAADIDRARDLSEQGWSQRRIAAEYEVTQATIWRALSGQLVGTRA